MEQDYVIKVTAQAEEQLREIAQYIATTLQEPAIARRILKRLEETMLSLSHFPNRVTLTKEEPWRSMGVRMLSAGNYLIYFWVNEDTKTVQITAIVFGKRDQSAVLNDMDME